LAEEQVAAGNSSGPVYWMLTDNQGTVRDVIDSTGTVVDHITYSAFGQPLPSTSSVDFLFGYTGRYYDSVTKLQWNQNRWYNPSLQRWMGQDPDGLAFDANPYRYCGNGPTDGADPTGEGTPANGAPGSGAPASGTPANGAPANGDLTMHGTLPAVPPADQPGEVTVFVGGYEVAGGKGYHTFLLISHGKEYVGFRAGPSKRYTGKGSNPVHVESGVFGCNKFTDTHLGDNAAATRLKAIKFKGGADGLIKYFQQIADFINSLKIEYNPTPPMTGKTASCNSVTRWFLVSVGVPSGWDKIPNWKNFFKNLKPGGVPAGWNEPLPKDLLKKCPIPK
jgi:RHS repeat-associated protein